MKALAKAMIAKAINGDVRVATWDFIEDDRGKHLSWKKLENKYDIPFDTIKKRLKYRAKN